MQYIGFSRNTTVSSKHQLYCLIIVLLTSLSLACSTFSAWFSSSSPTKTPTPPQLVEVAVTVVYPTATATSTPLPTLTPTPTTPPTDTPPPLPTDTTTATPVPPTPAPTNTLSPPTPTPTEEVAGIITLVEPEHNLLMPVLVRDFEFKWRWSGGCELSTEYAFELRIWPPGGEPMGAMDAITHRKDVYCDPVSGLYSYTVPNLKDAPGPMSVAVETAATGPFLWNVALLRTYPAIVPVATSDTRMFTIPGDYVGPYDTTRPTVTCLNFSNWLEAQALFLATGGPAVDLNKLDPDGNGIACDELRR
jgi:hypothetical protein